MRRGLLALAIAAAACPNLDGAPCANDANCPDAQHCVAARCVTGSRSKLDYNDAGPDAGPDAGFDAGPDCAGAPLAGRLTLNGGYPLPTTNNAWADAWDHPPTLVGPDGGPPFEAPQYQVQVHSDGTYSLGVGVGRTYWIAGQYDFHQNNDAGDLLNDSLSYPAPVFAGFTNACDYNLDVSTLRRCEVITGYAPAVSSAPYVIDAVVDAPQLSGGGELSPAVSQMQVPDAGSSGTLTLILQADPTALDAGSLFGVDNTIDGGPGLPVWAKAGGLPIGIGNLGTVYNAFAGDYAFTIAGTGYPMGECHVEATPQSDSPVVQGVTPSDGGYAVTFKSANDVVSPGPGEVLQYADLVLVGTTDNDVLMVQWLTPPLAQDPTYHSAFVPTTSCPATRTCVLVVFSLRFKTTHLGATPVLVSEESSGFIYYPFKPQ